MSLIGCIMQAVSGASIRTQSAFEKARTRNIDRHQRQVTTRVSMPPTRRRGTLFEWRSRVNHRVTSMGQVPRTIGPDAS